MSERRHVLPPACLPRGLSREQSAEYVGVSPSKFDQLVADKRMPLPKAVDGRRVWDRYQLDLAFSALPDVDGHAEMKEWECVA